MADQNKVAQQSSSQKRNNNSRSKNDEKPNDWRNKVKAKHIPIKFSPVEISKAELEIPKGINENTFVIAITGKKYRSSITVTRPMGMSHMDRNSFIFAEPTDLAGYKGLRMNPQLAHAEAAYTRACIKAGADAGILKIERNGKVYYMNVDKTVVSDKSREQYVKEARAKASAALKEARAAHLAAEIAAGRDGKKPSKQAKKNPKPKPLPKGELEKFQWTNYLSTKVSSHEARYQDLIKSEAGDDARYERQMILERHTTFIGPGRNKKQVEAVPIKGVYPDALGPALYAVIEHALQTRLPEEVEARIGYNMDYVGESDSECGLDSDEEDPDDEGEDVDEDDDTPTEDDSGDKDAAAASPAATSEGKKDKAGAKTK